MAKVTLDWKAPSDNKMREYVKTLGEEKMKSFAKACIIKTEEGKPKVVKSKAKNWLIDNCDEKDIEWKNKPEKAVAMSGADEIASWLDL